MTRAIEILTAAFDDPALAKLAYGKCWDKSSRTWGERHEGLDDYVSIAAVWALEHREQIKAARHPRTFVVTCVGHAIEDYERKCSLEGKHNKDGQWVWSKGFDDYVSQNIDRMATEPENPRADYVEAWVKDARAEYAQYEEQRVFDQIEFDNIEEYWAYRLHYREGRSLPEVAEIMGRSKSQVSKLAARGKDHVEQAAGA